MCGSAFVDSMTTRTSCSSLAMITVFFVGSSMVHTQSSQETRITGSTPLSLDVFNLAAI